MKSLIWMAAVLLAAGVIFAGVGFLWWQESLKPVSPNSKIKTIIVVKRGESGQSIAKKLKEANLIKSQKAFLLYLKLNPTTLQAGTFRLSPGMSLAEIVKELASGRIDVWVVIPEGLRKEEVAAKIDKELDFRFSQKAFLKLAANSEGFLFPDTYLFSKEATAGSVFKIIRSNFDKKALASAKKAAKKHGLSIKEVVTLASLVEREAKYEKGRLIVASILLKRLQQNWPLQVDATLQYIKGNKTHWWPVVSGADKEVQSNYNTYKYPGLPPSPIANPGLAVINAVYKADPETDYWFYVSDKNGRIHPAKTLQEHQQNIRKYL
ncbi:MAG: endolytic transglycosylase MltG [bacterium]|nr:endolytic transglycosylase MltG [bacterium]